MIAYEMAHNPDLFRFTRTGMKSLQMGVDPVDELKKQQKVSPVTVTMYDFFFSLNIPHLFLLKATRRHSSPQCSSKGRSYAGSYGGGKRQNSEEVRSFASYLCRYKTTEHWKTNYEQKNTEVKEIPKN